MGEALLLGSNYSHAPDMQIKQVITFSVFVFLFKKTLLCKSWNDQAYNDHNGMIMIRLGGV